MVDLTPSKRRYMAYLQVIAENSEVEEDREWAKEKLTKLKNGARYKGPGGE